MKKFKYDAEKLLQAIRERPCLWNKNLENYKDRVEKQVAWNEIYNILDSHYEQMSSDDQRLTRELITSKWANIRDAFVKSIKKKGKNKKKHYLYNHLKFLLDIIPESEIDHEDYTDLIDGTHSETLIKEQFDNEEANFIEQEMTEESEEEVTPVYQPSTSKRKRVKRETYEPDMRIESPRTDNSNIDFVSIDEHRIMNEDEAFFASLLPSVVRYSEEERLEFRIEVLAVMKRISDKKKISY